MKKATKTIGITLGVCIVAGGALFGAVQLQAHEGAMGVTKERMDAMKSFGEAVGAMSDMIKGKIAYDGARVKQGAETIKTHAGEKLIAFFPEGSMDDHTEALPAIWLDFEKFSNLAAELQINAVALEAASESQDTFMPAFIDLTNTCTACHTKFREEQED